MAFQPWYIEPEPGPVGTLSGTTPTTSQVLSAAGASNGASATASTTNVNSSDLAALQAALFAAIAAEAAIRAGADASETSTRIISDNSLQGEIDALHAADTQIYSILINGTGGGGGGGGGPDRNDNGAFGIACIGTNTGTAAYQLALEALSIATAGTNGLAAADQAIGQVLTIVSSATTSLQSTNAALHGADTQIYSILTSSTNSLQATDAALHAADAQIYQILINGTGGSSDRNDNGAFGIACIGTNTGTAAYQLALEALSIAQAGTIGLVAADQAIFQVEGIAVSGSNTANTALALAQTFTTVLGAGTTGTFSFNMAQVTNSRLADIAITITNGVVTAVTDSRFQWDDFMQYASGTVFTPGTLNKGSAWNGPWSVSADAIYSVVGSEPFEAYSLGTVFSPFVVGFPEQRWLTGGTIAAYAFTAIIGTEAFETFSTGTVLTLGDGTMASTGTVMVILSGGTGWTGAGTVYSSFADYICWDDFEGSNFSSGTGWFNNGTTVMRP